MANRCANTDRISHLPPEITEKILNLLPCRDAVRTSILSSDWRYKWISMTDLNFGGVPWRDEYKHVKFITQFLSRHQGPIRKFSVTARTPMVGYGIEKWLKLVSKHDIEEVQVDARYGSNCDSYSCLLNCKKLTHLELSRRMFNVPLTFEGFMNLKVLNLSNIKVEDKSIESLISKCPLLERLSLYILYCSNIPITISAPKMKSLFLQGNLEDICLKKSPVLVDMSLSLCGNRPTDCDLIKILGGAPNLEKLKVEYFKPFTIRFFRGVLSTTFSYLKVMTLHQVNPEEIEAIQLVLELLRSAPNLEKLRVDIFNDSRHSLPNEADSDFWQKEYLVGHCFMKLKFVEMGRILWMAYEIEFAKFILSNSPVLEKMTMKTHESNQSKLTYMLKELSSLPGASQVAFTFTTFGGVQLVV